MVNQAYVNLTLKQTKRLLQALTDLARECSLTGSLGGGARAGIRHYNSLLDYYVERGIVPTDLFVHLDTDESNFDELGIACALLKAFIDDEDEPAQPVSVSSAIVVHSDSIDSQELRELRELREILRERMPDRP